VQIAAEAQQVEERVVHDDGPVARGPVETHEGARIAEDREGGLDAIHLVEHVARGRDVSRVFAGERDLEPAGHRLAVDADPVIGGLVGRGELEAQQLAPADGPGRVRRRWSHIMGRRFKTQEVLES
jgi:hypothetical protein